MRRSGRRRGQWLSLLALCVFIAVARPAAQQYKTIEVESLKITIDSEWVTRTAPGYLPVRFDITNTGDARVIEIVANGSRFFRPPPRAGTAITLVRQAVPLAKGDHVRFTMPLPIYADNENVSFQIREDGRVLEQLGYGGLQSHLLPRDASVLFVATSGSPFGEIAPRLHRPLSGPRAFVSTTPSGVPSGGASLDFTLEPDRLPTNWLGYTSVRAVAIGKAEWEQLSDGQKSALLTWTACGGDLIFVDGDLRAILPQVEAVASSDPSLSHPVAHDFLGHVHAVTSDMFSRSGLAAMLASTEKSHEIFWAMPANTAPDYGAIEGRGFRLRIPGINGVPARVYVLILLLFSLLIGPVNYWFLWRKKRLVLVVLTAPIISAAFIVLLAGYAVAGEGFHVQGRAMTFTVLDQAAKQAVTRSTVSMYAAGLAPSGGLRFSRDVAIFPIGQDGSGARDRLNLDLSEMQSFTGGVLQARTPTNFEEIVSRPARERLTFTHEQGGLSVTNGLEAGISMLLFKDGDTLYRLSGPLASGGKQVLNGAPVENTLEGAVVAIPSKFLDLVKNQPRGSYIAVLDRSPFWEPGVPSLIEHGSAHIVLGWPEGQR